MTKKLALLLLALPLAACVGPPKSAEAPIPKFMLEHIAAAESQCRADNVGPSDPHYSRCVNDFLRDQYGMSLFRDQAGALRVARAPNTWPSPDATDAFAGP